ncbi:uroporphyrinogen-III synthase [Lysinibacillus sp. KU-BSD001]|uniref:uroporphyrinogen-III synthase n=1 Tax=Lysinibacillus sp. KU-BSD001 TaxID=3141328 RepID=UPI0036EFC666
MPSNRLEGQTIVLTGSVPTLSVKQFIEENGGLCAVFPLIKTQEYHSPNDAHQLASLHSYDWLIFTSQNAVQAFMEKCQRAEINIQGLRCKVASVGTKTTELLEKYGLHVDFMPSIFSADVFVKEFPHVSKASESKLFIRGSLAKQTIHEGVPNVTEWTVYETCANATTIQPFIELLEREQTIVIFASPSAVDVFAKHIAPIVGWSRIRAAAIGHITADALERLGVAVYVQPKVYTMQAVVEEIILLEESS